MMMMTMIDKYNVLIIGAGRIGAFFDSPLDEKVLTHAHAFYNLEATNIVGFVDLNFDNARKASERWGGKPYCKIKEAFNENQIDIVCIAVPDELHFSFLKELSEYNLKFIFTEKPLTKSITESIEILDLYKDKKLGFGVNYTRRFVREFHEIKRKYEGGHYGRLLSGTQYYGKGIVHNGSHAVDLLRFLFGEIVKYKSNYGMNDFYEDDPSIGGVLYFDETATITLIPVDCRHYTVFETELFFEKKRIRFVESGFKIEEYDVVESDVFQGYKSLSKPFSYETTFSDALYYAAQNIVNFIENEEPMLCTLEDAYVAQKICNELKEGIR